jgi:nucleoside-diphosphate-sugar epimerase
VHHLSVSCAQEAAKQGVKRFIEVSTAQVYEPSNKPKDESGKVDPWTNLAKWKLQCEEDLKKIPGLSVVVVRPAIVYGPGDKTGIGTSTSFIPPPSPTTDDSCLYSRMSSSLIRPLLAFSLAPIQ